MAQSKMACWNITARDFRRVRGFPVAILDGDTQNIEVLYHWYMIDIWMYIYIIILWCYYYVYGLIWINMVETCWDHLFFPFNSIPNVGSTLEVFLAQQPWLWMGFLKISPQYFFSAAWAELLRLSCHLRTHHSMDWFKGKITGNHRFSH